MKASKIIGEIVNDKPLHLSPELLSWIRQSPENRNEYIRYKNVWALLQEGREMSNEHLAEDFGKVKRRLKSPGRLAYFRGWAKYAAIIVLALAAGYLFHSTVPFLLQQTVSMNEVSVPNGNRSQIILPDGSRVWLTNGSKISYPEQFARKSRSVTLEGEAFFTVIHDEKRPFYVNLGDHRVKVLGTEFSVVAYPDDDKIRVDLVSGEVQMDVSDGRGNYNSYVLKQRHGLILDKTAGTLKNNVLIPDGFLKYWQEGLYEFNNEPFEELARKIERIYSVKIVFEDSRTRHIAFTGAFHIDSNIYTIIEALKRASQIPFKYSIEKDKIYIKTVK